jgi:hypothetical protein
VIRAMRRVTRSYIPSSGAVIACIPAHLTQELNNTAHAPQNQKNYFQVACAERRSSK